MKPLETIEIQANQKLLVLVGIMIIFIILMFNLAGLLGISAIILCIYVLVYICCYLNGKVEIYEEYLKIFPIYLDDRYKRSLWDKKVKIPWQDVYCISSNKKEALIDIPFVENLITEINIYNHNMVEIAQINVSIFADDNYWNSIRSAFLSRGISVDGEKLHNFTDSTKEDELETTSINYERENLIFNEIDNIFNTSSEIHQINNADDTQKVPNSRRRNVVNSSRETKVTSSNNRKESKGRRLEL